MKNGIINEDGCKMITDGMKKRDGSDESNEDSLDEI